LPRARGRDSRKVSRQKERKAWKKTENNPRAHSKVPSLLVCLVVRVVCVTTQVSITAEKVFDFRCLCELGSVLFTMMTETEGNSSDQVGNSSDEKQGR
jgi:hypothetical protein